MPLSVSLSKLCPMMASDKRERLVEAQAEHNLATIAFEKGNISEMDVFTRKYEEIKSIYVAAVAGSNPLNMKAVLDMFNEYQPVVECVASYHIHEQVKGTLACDVAESNKDVVMRPICEDSFGTTAANTINRGPYTQTLTRGTARNYIPSQASINDGGAATWTATREQQTIVILGYAEFMTLSEPVVSRIQETISDRVDDRRPLEVYLMQKGDMKVLKRNSAEWVEDDTTLDINVTAINNGRTGMYPIGVDFAITSLVNNA